jgi:hypothetical protein
LITLDWVYQLPFGRGKAFGVSSGRVLEAAIGGWQWSGLTRWTSGLPFSVLEPGWSTNWHIQSYGVRTGPVKVHKHLDQNGEPQVFDNVAESTVESSVKETQFVFLIQEKQVSEIIFGAMAISEWIPVSVNPGGSGKLRL